uniref:Cilia- and flagella-associated protein 300 n=1 Tax=Tetradesmus obliquus TaxID=3088 RepID=A0A383WNR8_TETOB|eukprot:jgi/Sobl393_1/19829/SZX78842.1
MTIIESDQSHEADVIQPAEPQNSRLSAEFLDEPYVKSLLKKWDMHDGKLQLLAFHYSKHYSKLQLPELIADLFNSAALQQRLQVAAKSGDKLQLQGSISGLKLRQVPASETRMDMFDRLLTAEPPVVRQAGQGDIVKCMDEVVDGVQVSDELRRLLLVEDSEHAKLYSSEERGTLLFRLFELLCIGGACCQYEDQLQPYLEVTKRLYKALLSVQKSSSGQVDVTSSVFEVTACSCESGVQLFPCVGARSNMCLVTVDPLRRLLKVLYHAHVPYW